MNIKVIGITFVVISCAAIGFLSASSYRKQIAMLRNFITVLEFMECELQFRMTPLPDLCRQAAAIAKSSVKEVLLALTYELESQISPDVEQCMYASLSKTKDVPREVGDMFSLLGTTLGRFDMDGQLKGLVSVRTESMRVLDALQMNQNERVRSYRTLGICAGAAIAILLI